MKFNGCCLMISDASRLDSFSEHFTVVFTRNFALVFASAFYYVCDVASSRTLLWQCSGAGECEKKWQQERKTFLIRYHHLLWWNFFFFLFPSPYSHAMLYMKNPRKWTFASSSVSNSKWVNIPRKKRNIYFPLCFSEKENSDGKTFSISSAKASFWLT